MPSDRPFPTRCNVDSWPRKLSAITLFTEDLEGTKQFYADVFGVPKIFEDESSAVFNFGNTIVNLLSITAVPELIDPAAAGRPDDGPRAVLTVDVDDVDAVCAAAGEARRPAPERADGSAVGRPDRELPRPGRAPLGDREVAGRTRRDRRVPSAR